jgi:hypothetical protein
MVMTMAVIVVMVVAVIMAAAAGIVMLMMRVVVPMPVMLVPMTMVVLMAVVAVVIPMVMMLTMAMMVIMAAVLVIIGAALGPEGAGHGGEAAALAAHHLGDHVVVFDIDRLGGDLRWGMAIAEMPGDLEQPERIFGADLQKLFLGCLDRDKAAILELQSIAVIEDRRFFEIDQHVEPTIGGQRYTAALAAFMVEGERVDDTLGLDGGLADNGCSARHGLFSRVIGSPAGRFSSRNGHFCY